MKIILRYLAIALFLLGIACGTTGGENSPDAPLRLATEAPNHFTTEEGLSPDENTCRSRLIDPDDGTQLLLVRSFGDGRGDYRVPDGRYGVRKGELLRIDCSTGEVLGIVRR